MTFNLFVLPFFLGLIFLLINTGRRYSRWVRNMEQEDRSRFMSGLRSKKFLFALKEIFFDSLLHRKMFRRNTLLGYMHMTFAFGWLLLIIMGNMESRIYSGLWVNPPYYPIFLKFFIHDKHVLPFEIFTVPGFFRFSMDLVLFFILSGLALALLKRRNSKWFGMKKTTQLQLTDKVAMTALWLIFPLRLLAESFTAGAYGYGGGFVTQHFGNVLAAIWPFSDKLIAYGFWWVYSLSLGIFFVTLPYSRYTHIPSELLLILFRNFGINQEKHAGSFSDVEIFACSRCGVCIDVCQLSVALGINDIQSTYFLRSIRDRDVSRRATMTCLVCGRCTSVCPVGIGSDNQRLSQRRMLALNQAMDYSYLPVRKPQKANVAYFAGCMTHLTPGISRSMEKLLEVAGVKFTFLDKDETICCGRPLMLSGRTDQAKTLVEKNKELINRSGATLLVTSCPICYRVFREEYHLEINVMHHSQYILQLIRNGNIPLQARYKKVAYHDPCDLGRGSEIFKEPLELLEKVADVVNDADGCEKSLCCGGSLGIFNIDGPQRASITRDTLDHLMDGNPETIVTSCPLCKKTLSAFSPVRVEDIAEIIYAAIPVILIPEKKPKEPEPVI